MPTPTHTIIPPGLVANSSVLIVEFIHVTKCIYICSKSEDMSVKIQII